MSTVDPLPPPLSGGPFPEIPNDSAPNGVSLSYQITDNISPSTQAPTSDHVILRDFNHEVNSALTAQRLQDALARMMDPKTLSGVADDLRNSIQILRQDIDTVNSFTFLQDNAQNIYATVIVPTYNSYNDLSTTYNTELTRAGGLYDQISAYNNAVAAYNTAGTTYNAAIATWNQAQIDFAQGTINQAQLDAAQATYDAATLDFNNAVATFNTAIATYNGYVTGTFQPLLSTIQSQLGGLSVAINQYNDFVDQLNALSAQLSQPATYYSPISASSDFPSSWPTIPSAPLVPTTVDTVNPPSLTTGLTLPPAFSSVDLQVLYLDPRLPLLEYNKNTVLARQVANQINDNIDDKSLIRRKSTTAPIGGAGASIFLAIAGNQISIPPNIESIVSRHLFAMLIKASGVPTGSPLVDSIALVTTLLLDRGQLLGAGLAKALLGGATNAPTGTLDLVASTALLTNTLSFASQPALKAIFVNLLATFPEYASLPTDQQDKLAGIIANDVGYTLVEIALNKLAQSLGLPGLSAQVVRAVAGESSVEATDILENRDPATVVFLEKTLTDAIVKQLEISREEAQKLADNALESSQQLQTALDQSIKAAGIAQSDETVAQILATTSQSIAQSFVNLASHQIALASAATQQEFDRKDLDVAEAIRLAQNLVGAGVNNLQANAEAALIATGSFSDQEAKAAARRISGAVPPQALLTSVHVDNASIDVLSSFLVDTVRSQTFYILGPQKAQYLAETLNAAMFTSPHSVLNLLRNHREIDQEADTRLEETLKTTDHAFRQPQEHLTHLAMLLISNSGTSIQSPNQLHEKSVIQV